MPEGPGINRPKYIFGDFTLDVGCRVLLRGGQEIGLSPKPFDTLVYLIEHRDCVVTKSELLEQVWKGGLRVASTVHQTIHIIRGVLADDDKNNPLFIQTLPGGHGYRFIAPVTLAPDAQGRGERPRGATRHSFSPAAFVLAAVLALSGAAASSLFVLRRHVPVPSKITHGMHEIIAWDVAGRVLWSYPVDRALSSAGISAYPGDTVDTEWRTQIVDLNGDGRPQVLFAAVYEHPPRAMAEEEIFCLSSDGKLLWRYKPEARFAFNTRDLNGSWKFAQMQVIQSGRDRNVWAVVDHTSLWPSYIVKISPSGRAQLQFVNSGAIFAIKDVETHAGTLVVAGGVNNEYKSAAVAILPANGPPSSSPQSRAVRFACLDGCPKNTPLHYYLLPPSEVNSTVRPYNWVISISKRLRGLAVETLEDQRSNISIWDFTEQLHPEDVVHSSGYDAAHRQLEREGLIKHPLDACKERLQPALVRSWDQSSGWKSTAVAWVR